MRVHGACMHAIGTSRDVPVGWGARARDMLLSHFHTKLTHTNPMSSRAYGQGCERAICYFHANLALISSGEYARAC